MLEVALLLLCASSLLLPVQTTSGGQVLYRNGLVTRVRSRLLICKFALLRKLEDDHAYVSNEVAFTAVWLA